MPAYSDLLVCGVSTRLDQHVRGFDELIVPEDDDFAGSGLLAASVIRLGFLAVLPAGEYLVRSVPFHLSDTSGC
jgi:mRNA interferase MazF